jgi:Flp pilus assembly protein TadG
MIRRRTRKFHRHGERGVTMVLVALALMSMLAMVALAIDVITLYSARSETQRAADAAALAAAKMLVDAGVTGDPGNAGVQTTAKSVATQVAKDVATKSAIAGRTIQPSEVTVTFPGPAANFGINPRVNVSVVNANLPTFFSRIWSRATLTVRAAATAEAFNPSNSSSIAPGGAGLPVIARCVKPFIIPNCDPVNANNLGSNCGAGFATFFNPATGAITNPGLAPTGIIGESFHLNSDCGAGPGCAPGAPFAGMGPGGRTVQYYPAQLPAATNSCPNSCTSGTTFEQNISCCNPTPISCGTTSTAPAQHQLLVDTTVFPEGGGGPAQSGVECLIHQRPGNGMDILNVGPPMNYPPEIQVGNNHPLAGTPVLSANDLVTTSDSLVTIPVYDGASTPASGVPINIIGFLQVFIVQAFPAGGGPKAGEFEVVVVNVLGCGTSATGTPVSASATVPVRLVQ